MPEENIPLEYLAGSIAASQTGKADEKRLSESQLPPVDATAAGESTTSNTENNTTDMEVHHHPDLHHKPKPFKEFVLEFIMIFLAVTMGFFAESFREYLANHEKEDEAVHSLAEDLRVDTAAISSSIDINYQMAQACDTLVALLNNYKPIDSINHKLYNSYIATTTNEVFNPTERTLAQLKNMGSMQIIKNKTVADEIVNYENAIVTLKDYSKIYNSYTEKSVNEAAEIFNLNYLKYYVGHPGFDSVEFSDTSFVIDPAYRNKPLPLRDDNPKLLSKYANSVWYQQLVVLNYRQLLKQFKQEQISFIELLKKEYKGE
jgi:hypothetical protein